MVIEEDVKLAHNVHTHEHTTKRKDLQSWCYQSANLIQTLLLSITSVYYKNVTFHFIQSGTKVTLLEYDTRGQLQMHGTSFGSLSQDSEFFCKQNNENKKNAKCTGLFSD